MKFLKGEYDAFMSTINDEGYDQSQFSFVKKKGMLHVEMRGSATSFCFFRKKESEVNGDKTFDDRVTYFVGPKKEIARGGWDDVLDKFRGYLSDGVQ